MWPFFNEWVLTLDLKRRGFRFNQPPFADTRRVKSHKKFRGSGFEDFKLVNDIDVSKSWCVGIGTDCLCWVCSVASLLRLDRLSPSTTYVYVLVQLRDLSNKETTPIYMSVFYILYFYPFGHLYNCTLHITYTYIREWIDVQVYSVFSLFSSEGM